MKYEDREFERDMREYLRAMEARVAKLRWLVTLRTADGAERHETYVGAPPREWHVPLPWPLPSLSMTAEPPSPEFRIPERIYERRKVSQADGTILYVERTR